jgi:hypothetical protein
MSTLLAATTMAAICGSVTAAGRVAVVSPATAPRAGVKGVAPRDMAAATPRADVMPKRRRYLFFMVPPNEWFYA